MIISWNIKTIKIQTIFYLFVVIKFFLMTRFLDFVITTLNSIRQTFVICI